MEVLYACCCGIDVHAKMLVACLLKQGKKEVRTCSTMTEELLHLLDWLIQEGCTHVAIESTGHSILGIAYHVLQTRRPYQELGSDYFVRRNVDKQRKRLVRQLESRGVKVKIEEIKEAA